MTLFDRRGAMTMPREDYDLLLAEATGKQSVLEFGPGFSTFAFIEAGVPRILCCEYLEEWRLKAIERFKDYPQVEVIRFWDDPVAVADQLGMINTGADGMAGKVGDYIPMEEFDLAFVDSPKGYAGARVIHPGQEDCSRFNTCLLALQHAPVVLLHDAGRPLERGTLGRLNQLGYPHKFVNTRMARITNVKNKSGSSEQGALQSGCAPCRPDC